MRIDPAASRPLAAPEARQAAARQPATAAAQAPADDATLSPEARLHIYARSAAERALAARADRVLELQQTAATGEYQPLPGALSDRITAALNQGGPSR